MGFLEQSWKSLYRIKSKKKIRKNYKLLNFILLTYHERWSENMFTQRIFA